MKKGYIKLIAAVILGIAIIGGGIYGVYTLLSSNTTTILYRSTVDDKINAIRPYIVALDTYNSYSVAYANQLQPTLLDPFGRTTPLRVISYIISQL